MPLTIVDAETDPETALSIFHRARALTFRQNGDAGMGGFWISEFAGLDTVLTTSGAITCVIIVIRTMDGNGALGHFAADADPNEVVRGVDAMLAMLGRPAIDAVLFAAGLIGGGPEQAGYQAAIIDATRLLAPGATVEWRLEIGIGDIVDAAVFLPRTGEVALFDSLPQHFIGRLSSDPGNGLRCFTYGALLS